MQHQEAAKIVRDQTPFEYIQTRAQQIFDPLPVVIIHLLNDSYNVRPIFLYESTSNVLALNVNKFMLHPEFLEPALVHEFAHFVYQDYLNRINLCILGKASNKFVENVHQFITQVILNLQRTMETRADVYAAKRMDNLKPLIAYLRALSLLEEHATGLECIHQLVSE